MRGHDCLSEGLRPLRRVDPDLERDPDSRQHATQHNDLGRRHALGPSGLDEGELVGRVPGEGAGHCDRGHRPILQNRASLHSAEVECELNAEAVTCARCSLPLSLCWS